MLRVVVSGIGLITPIGTGRKEVWDGLLGGRCGIRDVESFDTRRLSVHRAAEVRGFRARDHFRHLDPAEMGRTSQMAVSAARLALDDARLDPRRLEADRVGVVLGTASGEPLEIEAFDERYVVDELEGTDRKLLDRYPCDVIAGRVAREFGFSGVNFMVPTACAAGIHAIAFGLDALRLGRADLMLAGGADSLSRLTFSGFARLGAVAPERCQPFDRGRQGMIPGEGAGVLVLEPLEQARRRCATIYAELLDYGLSCDAFHMTSGRPDGDGAVRAMRHALERSRMRPDEISYISAHGTGTETNDRVEAQAVRRVFSEVGRHVPMSSVKSMLGHTMGAASAIETAVCALAAHGDLIPPTMHFERPDPECDVDCVPNRCREHRVTVAMNNAYAFGGTNASLILRKWTA